MCGFCGCTGEAPAPPHVHTHPDPARGETIRLERAVLARNDARAERNRAWLERLGAVAINLLSSPGAGKTTLLERTLRDLAERHVFRVIEGDQATSRDAERIRAAGARAHQVNTGTGCHLDATMVHDGLHALEPLEGAVVFIENVGNLVCPALFDLGERARVVIASVPEGDDKPLKYPHMFRTADLVVLNKADLRPHIDTFDLDRFVADARRVNPEVSVLEVSATRGTGLDKWYGWLETTIG